MERRLRFFLIIFGCLLFSCSLPIFVENVYSKQSLKINLKKELKKGNLLIGLKRYLGGENDTFSQKKVISFSTKNDFLNLRSLNGIEYKSKKINIEFRKIPLDTPYSVERLVFGPFSSYESAQKKAQILKDDGYEATVVYPKNWEVWITDTNKLQNKKLKYKTIKKSYNYQIIPFLSTDFTQHKLQSPIFISSDDLISINNKNFGKKFYLAKDSYGTWTLIQKIKFDDYLEGVLPYEIGPNSPLEALKAQAVIARTWAIYNSERFNMDKYHLCITSQCQVYKPTNIEYKNVSKAIKDTSNLIISYKNKPINSFYHGSNGGISASASESWQINDYVYFNPIIDGEETLEKYYTLPMVNEKELNRFLDEADEKIYGDNHSLFRWEKIITKQKILDYLQKKQIIKQKTDFVDIKIADRGFSGRVTKLKIKTNDFKKSIILEKDEIRRILSFIPSNLFIINKLNDNLWLFKGGGFGHGVGLSQSGAIEMAELGFTYEQILNHYYQGTNIRKIEIMSQ